MVSLHQNQYREICNRSGLTKEIYVNELYNLVADKVFENIWNSSEVKNFTFLTEEEITDRVVDEIDGYARRLYDNGTIMDYDISKIAQRIISESLKRLDTMNRHKEISNNQSVDVVDEYNTIKESVANAETKDVQAELIHALIEKYTTHLVLKKVRKAHKYKRMVTAEQNYVLEQLLTGKTQRQIAKELNITPSAVRQRVRWATENISKDYNELMTYFSGDDEKILESINETYEMVQTYDIDCIKELGKPSSKAESFDKKYSFSKKYRLQPGKVEIDPKTEWWRV